MLGDHVYETGAGYTPSATETLEQQRFNPVRIGVFFI
jgi:hypothetical protein